MQKNEKKALVCNESHDNAVNNQSNYSRFLEMIEEIFPEKGFIELRSFVPGKEPVREFFATEDYKGIENYLAKHPINTFFGVAARNNKGGKKEDVAYCRVVWIDKDIEKDGDISTEEFIRKLSNFRFPPSCNVVNSGRGVHAYPVDEGAGSFIE